MTETTNKYTDSEMRGVGDLRKAVHVLRKLISYLDERDGTDHS